MSGVLQIANKYRISRSISGTWGDIYQGENVNTKQKVIFKMESVRTRHPILEYEYKVTRILMGGIPRFDGFENIKHITDKKVILTVFGYIRQEFDTFIPPQICFIILHYFHRPRKKCPNILNIKYYGREGDFRVMVMDELAKSLEDLFFLCNNKFSLKTVIMIADQMLSTIEFVHESNFVHRDLKPGHFVMGKNGEKIYLIDYGLAKRYRDPKRNNKHIDYKEGKSLINSRVRYASINNHLGIEQSRRDDLETIGYILVYFYLGKLPWMGLRAATKREKYSKILKKKMSVSIDKLCENMADEFIIYLNYCRGLRFDDKPNYNYLRRLFRDLYFRKGFIVDFRYDFSHLGPCFYKKAKPN